MVEFPQPEGSGHSRANCSQCIAWLPTSVPALVHSIQMLTAAVGLSDPEGKAALRPLIPSHLTWGLSAHTFPHPCSLCLSVTGL